MTKAQGAMLALSRGVLQSDFPFEVFTRPGTSKVADARLRRQWDFPQGLL